MSRGPQLVSGPSGTAAPAGGGGEQTKGLTFREDVGHGTGTAFTVMIPSVFAKIDKHLPMVNRKEIMEAYGKLSNTARQSLLTIVDKEFVTRLVHSQRAAWCAHIGDHSDPSSKYPRLMQLFDTTNHNLLPQFDDKQQQEQQQPATYKDGYMLLEDNAQSTEISGKPDALQPRMRALMNHSLFDFIDERCDDFLRNAKRNRSRLVTRKEMWYRLLDGVEYDGVKYGDLDSILAQALEFRILSEYYKDRFASLQRLSRESQREQQQQEMSPFLGSGGAPQSSRFLQYIPYESVSSKVPFVDLEAGEQPTEQQQQQPQAAQTTKASKKRKKRQAKKAVGQHGQQETEAAHRSKGKMDNSKSGAKVPTVEVGVTGATVSNGINSSTVSTVVSPGASQSPRSRSGSSLSSTSSSSSSSIDSIIIHEGTLVSARGSAVVEPLGIRAPAVTVAADDSDGEWQTVGKNKPKRPSNSADRRTSGPNQRRQQQQQQAAAVVPKKQSAAVPSRGRQMVSNGEKGRTTAAGLRTAKDTFNGSAPKTSSSTVVAAARGKGGGGTRLRTEKTAPVLDANRASEESVKILKMDGGIEAAAFKRDTSAAAVKVKRTFYEFYEQDSTDVFSSARQQLWFLANEAPF